MNKITSADIHSALISGQQQNLLVIIIIPLISLSVNKIFSDIMKNNYVLKFSTELFSFELSKSTDI